MNPMQTDCPLRIFMLSVLLGMACLTVPWSALATGLGVLTAHFVRPHCSPCGHRHATSHSPLVSFFVRIDGTIGTTDYYPLDTPCEVLP